MAPTNSTSSATAPASHSHVPTLNSIEKLRSLHKRKSLDLTHSEAVHEACKPLELADEDLRIIMQRMEKAFNDGNSKENCKNSSIRQLPSFVRAVPNGSELGDFLALDLGGTNFRVLLIRLEKHECKMQSKIFRVPEYIMCGTGAKLFDHIAECMAKFMDEHDLKGRDQLPLGFTFSFPCSQEGLTCAKLVSWTKGFNASNVVGQDVVSMLRDACKRRGDIDVDVVALLNDTVGTLMACAFKEPTCNIGVIAGTGSNACYMERVDKMSKLEGIVNPAEDGLPNEICVNTEWGAFGDHDEMAEYHTKYDKIVDENSINKGKQHFEKMVAGMYLGEIVRIVLECLAREGHLFNGDYEAISQHNIFPTKFLSEIESELQSAEEDDFAKTQQILEEIGIPTVTQADCANVAYVCSTVSNRAAHLVAAGIATLLKRMKKPYVTVGIDGSVYRFHPTFPAALDKKVDELLDEDIEFQLMLSEDGSGRGAALVAAVATRMKNELRARQYQTQPGAANKA